MNIVIEQYIFELTERVVRFYLHLDAIREEFYVTTDQKVTDKLSFLSSYEECLEKALLALGKQVSLLNTTTINSTLESELLKINVNLSKQLNTLHENHLSHLPRPSEPVELHRFGRIIEKQVLHLASEGSINPNISIYVSEKLGEETYAFDPLSEFKINFFNIYIEEVNNILNQTTQKSPLTLFSQNFEGFNPENSSIHITIPRIDASNPCHWPVLVHEVAHHMLGTVFSSLSENNPNLESDFFYYLNTNQIKIEDIDVRCFGSNDKIIIDSWLTECWCDLFACMSMGYSYWFAQFSVFISQPSFTHTAEYPPALFRLWLIQRFLKHRFSGDVLNHWENLTTTGEDLLASYNKLESYDWLEIPKLKNLLEAFSLYFSSHFFQQKSEESILPGTINAGLLKVLRYTKDIKLTRIQYLLEQLKEGLPIPSSILNSDNVYAERPTSVQEILCVASIYRQTVLKEQVLRELTILESIDTANGGSFKDRYKTGIEKIVKRFDQAVLRSIQVSEWFGLFALDSDGYTLPDSSIKNVVTPGSILVDHQIVSQIVDRKLFIVPIFSLKQQLGSASIDIRLGTSFQLFSPNEYGIIDFANSNDSTLGERSNKKDLDFSQYQIIMPNQFILGHSMEYLKLPDHLTARLEGRSSFARLGIQIHMTAGFVDPGFEGVLTFEILNAGHSPVRLYPGLRIGQLIFSVVNEPLLTYSKKHSAKYKGLLEHHYSLQGRDYEISKLRSLKSGDTSGLYEI